MFIYGAALTMGKAMVKHGAADWLAGGLYKLADYGSEYGGDLSIIILIIVVFVTYYLTRPTSKREKDNFNSKNNWRGGF